MNFYTGKTGQEYYDMRAARRSDFVQDRRASHFQPHINESDIVLDFGCGTGGVLARLKCNKKIGIEVNGPSIEQAKANGIDVFDSLDKIEDGTIDVVISNHALEHVPNSAEQIVNIKRVLKQGGKAILVVPAENPASLKFSKWQANDPDQHIYSWTPMSFGNLINQCGLKVEKSYRHNIGYSKYIEPIAGLNEKAFQCARKAVGFILKRYEVVCISKND